MKRIEKGGELLWFLGVIMVAMGVAICSKADLGVSMIAAPAFIINEYVSGFFPQSSVGMMEYIIQGLILLLLCVLVRKFTWKYLMSFVVAVIYGYTLDLCLLITGRLSADTVAAQWILLLIGDAVTAFGVACFFRTYLPLQVYELFVAELSSCKKLDIIRTKRWFDITLLLVSVALAVILFGDVSNISLTRSFHSLGPGTIVTTVINSILIKYSGRLIDRFLGGSCAFPSLYAAFKR